MAVCQPCRDGRHPGCESVNCCCGHRGSNVRALTSAERQLHMLGTTVGNVIPINQPRIAYVIPAPSSNGNGTP